MNYQRIFNPNSTYAYLESVGGKVLMNQREYSFGDSPSLKYLFSKETILAINVALVTGRPLLVRGPTGCGKSAMAEAVARVLKRRFCQYTITSHTQMKDLCYEIDLVHRLADAQVKDGGMADDVTDLRRYIRPGPFLRAFDPENTWNESEKVGDDDCKALNVSGEKVVAEGTLILLDEMDKADPDLPNNLLRTLGNMEFQIPELGIMIKAARPNNTTPICDAVKSVPLIFLTTNDEQSFSNPFLRRCIRIDVKKPKDQEGYTSIAMLHFGKENEEVYEDIAKIMLERCEPTNNDGWPSIAEYLDAIRACIHLFPNKPGINTKIFRSTDAWKFIQEKVLGIPFKDEDKNGQRSEQ